MSEGRKRPKPLDIVTDNLVARLWDEDDPVCDAKARVIVRGVLGEVAAEARRDAERKTRIERTALVDAAREALETLDAWERIGDSENVASPIGAEKVIDALRAALGALP